MIERRTDWLTIIRFIIILLLSLVASIYAQPLIHDNKEARDLIINVFSILAGFLVAIMTFFSGTLASKDSSWRRLALQNQESDRKARKNKLLFFLYLLVLLFVFLSVLFPKESILVAWFERMYIFLTCMSFCYSLFLPANIYDLKSQQSKKLAQSKTPKGV